MSHAANSTMDMPLSVYIRALSLADMFARCEVESCGIGGDDQRYQLTDGNDKPVMLIEDVEPVLRTCAEYLVDRQLATWVETDSHLTVQLHVSRFQGEPMTADELVEDPRR